MSGDVIGVGGLLLTNIGVIIGIFKYFNARINRVYERFDEHKKEMADKYVLKDLCKIMHENSSSNLNGLETRINNSFNELKKEVKDNFAVVIDLMKKVS
jgi:hypothetical protein